MQSVFENGIDFTIMNEVLNIFKRNIKEYFKNLSFEVMVMSLVF